MTPEFEKWAEDQGYSLERDWRNIAYTERHVDAAWEAWQAAQTALRASMPVEEIKEAAELFGEMGKNLNYHAVQATVRANGEKADELHKKAGDYFIKKQALESLLPPSSKEPI